MKIVMFTNTYLPHVGGVARSVAFSAEALRERGHPVKIVAPTFDDMPEHEANVIRVPAIQHFNGSDFSVRLPAPARLWRAMEHFEPDIVHAHHPFLLGDTALRVASWQNRPVVFTHHTMYERYTHYVPGDSEVMRQFAIRLASDYANLCDHVIAPSESIRDVLRDRGVLPPITAVPTGIDPRRFTAGRRVEGRRNRGLPEDAFLVGHVGRLAPEKNLPFLARAVAGFLRRCDAGHALVVGEGPSEAAIRQAFEAEGVAERLVMPGSLSGQALADAYAAMDVFAFASQSETQGMVLAEAMTAGVPVVAVDAPGVREVVRDGHNGRLMPHEDEALFTAALEEAAECHQQWRNEALRTAEAFSLDRCVDRLLEVYGQATVEQAEQRAIEETAWTRTLRMLETEWNLWSERTGAAWESLKEP